MRPTRNVDPPRPLAFTAGAEAQQSERDQDGTTTTVVTSMSFAAPHDEVWTTILFYEQIEQRPPLYLQWLLPVPLGTEGRKTQVGDEARCLYEGGHLIKRVTQVEHGRRFCFEVSEQALEVGGGVTLRGGDYLLRSHSDGSTEVSLTTRYGGGRRPRWIFERIEAAICHHFHRHILRAMRQAVESRGSR